MNKNTNEVGKVVHTKSEYETPTMEVIELERQSMLLAGSKGSGKGTASWGNRLSDDYYDE